MDLLAAVYTEDEDAPTNEHSASNPPPVDYSSLISVNVNPTPTVTPLLGQERYEYAHKKEVSYNPRYDILFAPVQGPSELPPGMSKPNMNNTLTGHVENTNMNSFLFDSQYHTFHNYGFAVDPTPKASLSNSGMPVPASYGHFIGNQQSLQQKGASSVYEHNPVTRKQRKQRRKERKEAGDPASDDFLGPWAGPKVEAPVQQLTPEEVEEIEKRKPPSRKKRRQMERQAIAEAEGEDFEEEEEAEEPEKKQPKKKQVKVVQPVTERKDQDQEEPDEEEEDEEEVRKRAQAMRQIQERRDKEDRERAERAARGEADSEESDDDEEED